MTVARRSAAALVVSLLAFGAGCGSRPTSATLHSAPTSARPTTSTTETEPTTAPTSSESISTTVALVPAEAPSGARLAEFSSVRTDRDDRHLVVAFSGPEPGTDQCQAEYDSFASIDGEIVTVAIAERPRPDVSTGETYACRAMAWRRMVLVELPAPLAGREVIDASTGTRHAVFDGTLFVPSDAARTVINEGGASTGNSWTRTYALSETMGVQVAQAALDVFVAPGDAGMRVVDHPTIHGQRATLLHPVGEQGFGAQLQWQEADQAITVTAFATMTPTTSVTDAELIGFAQDLVALDQAPVHAPTAVTIARTLPPSGKLLDVSTFTAAPPDDELTQRLVGAPLATVEDVLGNVQTEIQKLSSLHDQTEPTVEQVAIGPVRDGNQVALFRLVKGNDRRLLALTIRTSDPPTIVAATYGRECTNGMIVSGNETCG
jgi:hypothetical protein